MYVFMPPQRSLGKVGMKLQPVALNDENQYVRRYAARALC